MAYRRWYFGMPAESIMTAGSYSAAETLRNGRSLEIRALRPDDRDGLLAAVARTGEQSLYRRFFTFKRSFTDREIDFFINVDFVSHVALVAVLKEDGQSMIVGGARYVLAKPGRAEVAFAVDDEHQRQGIGAALLRHLSGIARKAGLLELMAEVLPDNAAMLKVFEKSGLQVATRRGADAVHVVLRLS